MKRHPILILSLLFVSLLGSFVQAQTRPTPCNANTPNNALCTYWPAITTDTSGNPITGVNYRVEKATSASGPWTTAQASGTSTQYYATNLATGTHYFRVYANCTACTGESGASNVGSGAATPIPVIPNTPVIIIAATIREDGPPIYRIIQAVNLRPHEVVMVAPASWRPLFTN